MLSLKSACVMSPYAILENVPTSKSFTVSMHHAYGPEFSFNCHINTFVAIQDGGSIPDFSNSECLKTRHWLGTPRD